MHSINKSVIILGTEEVVCISSSFNVGETMEHKQHPHQRFLSESSCTRCSGLPQRASRPFERGCIGRERRNKARCPRR